MAEFYERFIHETFDADGRPVACRYEYGPDFNYGYDVADALAERHPDRVAMRWRDDRGRARDLTFADLRSLSDRAARLFDGQGLRRGDVLMAALRCHWQYWVVALAAHKLGLILAPVYHLLSEDDLAYRMRAARARGVVCCRDGDAPARVRAAADRAGTVAVRLTIDGAAEGFGDFDALLAAQPEGWGRVATDCRDPMLLYFTSGTTGQPKGVLHDFAYPLANHCGARYMQDGHDGSVHFATGDTGWEVVSGTKFYSQWLCLVTLLVYDCDRFSAEAVLSLLERERATSVMAQPTVYRKLTDVGLDRYDLSSVTCWAVGGEKLLPDLAETVRAQTGQPLYEGYAQSEAGLIAALSKVGGLRAGSMGRILPKYHVELLRPDGGFAASGEEGEIVLVADGGHRPEGLLIGYLGDEEATRQILDGTLYHTGDLAVRDADGFLYYRGRMDGIIKTKGYRVSPLEVEGLLGQHPEVYECLAAGIADRDLGQRIRAYVQLRVGSAPSETLAQALMAWHNARCTGYRKIRELAFVPVLPRNENGKLVRGRLPETDTVYPYRP